MSYFQPWIDRDALETEDDEYYEGYSDGLRGVSRDDEYSTQYERGYYRGYELGLEQRTRTYPHF